MMNKKLAEKLFSKYVNRNNSKVWRQAAVDAIKIAQVFEDEFHDQEIEYNSGLKAMPIQPKVRKAYERS